MENYKGRRKDSSHCFIKNTKYKLPQPTFKPTDGRLRLTAEKVINEIYLPLLSKLFFVHYNN